MSTMGCIPEFLKCQWVGEKTWPGGKEAEGSWTGRWVREKVTDTLSMSKWAHPRTHALHKTQSLGRGAKKKTPKQELEGTLQLQTFCPADGGRRSSCSGSRHPAWWCRFQKYFTEASNFSHDRGLAMATSTCTPRNGGVTSNTGFNVNGILVYV